MIIDHFYDFLKFSKYKSDVIDDRYNPNNHESGYLLNLYNHESGYLLMPNNQGLGDLLIPNIQIGYRFGDLIILEKYLKKVIIMQNYCII